MADRPSKRLRRQITESSVDNETEESSDDWQEDTIYVNQKTSSSQHQPPAMSRPRRAAAQATNNSSVTVSRSPSSSPDDRRKSIRLTVKMPSSKLREVTNSSPASGGDAERSTLTTGRRNVTTNSRSSFRGEEVVTGPRSSRTAKKNVAYQEVDEDEEDEDEDDDEDEEEEQEEEEDDEDEDQDMEDYSRLDAEAEADDDDDVVDAEDDEDLDMQDTPIHARSGGPRKPQQRALRNQITQHQALKPSLKVTMHDDDVQLKSVEEKEMEVDDEGEEELSELVSEVEEGDPDETGLGEEDAEGDGEDMEGDLDAEGDDDGLGGVGDELDSDDETPPSGSGASTPDLAKLTKRQRGRMDEGGGFLALPMEPQVKKVFTAEEHRMRRAEMARRRKNLSEKRNEEEKMTTINKLLKKQAPKRRGKAPNPETVAAATAGDATPNSQEAQELEKPNPLFTRWVSNEKGIKLGVPEEWLDKQVGRVFAEATRSPGLLVEEV